MIPLFKSHYSIGKSILTLDQDTDRSVFTLAKKADLSEVVLVEDSLIGFLEARKRSKDMGIDLRFGLRISMSNDLTEDDSNSHKVIVFAKNSDGCKRVNKIYSNAFSDSSGILKESFLRDIWSESDLKLAIPFYDSFIFNNVMTFATCAPDLSFADPTFFVEDNGLPFDGLISNEVDLYCDRNCYDTVETKSIFYQKKADFAAYQSYKCICNRGYKARTLDVPNFDHQGSDEFSFESWQLDMAAR